MDYPKDELFEKLADIEHQRWAAWQKYMFSKCKQNIDGSLVIPVELVSQWGTQIELPYLELLEKEKNSDREQVFRYWDLIKTEQYRNIGLMRQWLNEDRITDPKKMVTSEELFYWLDK